MPDGKNVVNKNVSYQNKLIQKSYLCLSFEDTFIIFSPDTKYLTEQP